MIRTAHRQTAYDLPTSHPGDDLLIAYASGTMLEVKSLLVATHLAYCPACRARVAEFESLCGDWLEALPPEPVSEDGLQALLGRLDSGDLQPPPPRAKVPLPTGAFARVPEPLRSRFPAPYEELEWSNIAPGIDLSTWSVADESTICLLRMQPGKAVPPHRHTADEMLLVLWGSYTDEYGQFRPGDVASYVGDTDHHATGDEHGECLCLFLLDGPLIFLRD
ncbi:ChrR family anti-sigma-E factor [Azospirillum sp. SYSU D00513]|uniref:ChrR family anti-sigma-E factor n=1 Tax=Azospirillum sp. SYSU D00513 TaxID=2812561 RepID=UPI0032B4241C